MAKKPKVSYTGGGTLYGLKHDLGARVEFDEDDVEWVSAETEEKLEKKLKRLLESY